MLFLLHNMPESFWILSCSLHNIPLTYWFELSGGRNTFAEEQQVHTELWIEMFMERDDFGN